LNGARTSDSHDLAIALAPVLRRVCEDRLGPVEWFRAAWQRGGAATGFSTWRADDGSAVNVLVKLPVGPVEYKWTAGLGVVPLSEWSTSSAVCLATPRVVAAGTDLGGYDLAWLVTERLSGPTLRDRMNEESVTDLIRAAADFQAAAMKVSPISDRPRPMDWDAAIEKARRIAREGGVPESQRWNEGIRKVQKALPILKARWESRPINAWCHGDLHPGNALRRSLPDGEDVTGRRGCVLIDLALVHPGHWLEDGLYLERQFWGHSELLGGVKPVSFLAKCRRERGLPVDDHYPELTNVRRILGAAAAPALMDREGNVKYLHAGLETIEKLLPQAIR
jgi:hypothetical protein